MLTPAQIEQTRCEVRRLRIYTQQLKRLHLYHKDKADNLEEKLREKDKRIKELEREKEKLQEDLEKVKRERDTYKGMVFKSKRTCSNPSAHTSGKKRGGQLGHTGHGRTKPDRIDAHIHAYLTNCPNCNTPVTRTSSFDTHIVSDIPHWSCMRAITTEYSIERQWCPNCKKEVRAQPLGVIPGSKLGINLFTSILVWKYRFRDPLNKIAERLLTHYNITVSEGTLVDMLAKAKVWFGPLYDEILKEIRGSPHKHADETGWRVSGENWWAWTGVTQKSTYYTIEESRGGGIAQEIFEGAKGVLIRDDYKAYEKLPLPQQSCWAHPLRIGHDLSHHENATEEVKALHKQLNMLFDLLAEDIAQPFNLTERKKLYGWYKQDLRKIINTPYQEADARKLQTRIKNQYTNLLTALLYEGIPLTNNAAERAIRPLVVTRKISGGSKTPHGAKIHAVNMSVIETIVKRKLPLLDTVQDYLLKGATGKN